MHDPTETIRREQVKEINSDPNGREVLGAKHGEVWDTSGLQQKFVVLGFMAPYVIVARKSDGQKGSLMFQGSPRFYFGWSAD
ncbi:hypothetical protein CA54_41130 [Symmachiella macrocystis]|uniref:Uncharacterized protein n=1 Tax=Symmachiella macrocystis TaxID=2527985 RepID=A0A5C6BEI6_9PLAN|nr:hypothetical protein [Symmachiella macrocystis]TWU08874.1 hypothetical protein CA54_41130 [Symmachiella macrocystis]